jgi:hypothetical protein
VTVTEILAKLEKVKQVGPGRWQAKCPAHGDNVPSLTVTTGADGRVLMNCHANCETKAIAAALGLQLRDLFAEESKPQPVSKPTIVAKYPYCDENGEVLFEAVRLQPKSFRQRRPDGKGGWVWNLDGVRIVPYRLPELLEADKQEPVFVVEGEKDVETLRQMGLVATTSPMGAGKWSKAEKAAREALRGRSVVVLPDNDKPGRDHALEVAESLRGIATTVRVLQLPGLPEKGDVSDWARDGGTVQKLYDLLARPAGAPEIDGINCEAFSVRLGREKAARVELIRRVIPFRVSFLDDALGGIVPTDLVLLTAKSGAGKTQLTAAISESAARAKQRVTVLALEAEEGEYERRIKYRGLAKRYRDNVAAAGVDPGIHLSYREWYLGRLDEPFRGLDEQVEAELAKDIGSYMHTIYRGADFGIEHIERVMTGLQDHTDLFVVDHLHFIDTDDSKGENAGIKAVMKRLRDMSLRLGKPVFLVAHMRKADRFRPTLLPSQDDIHGSSDIVKICTRVIAIGQAKREDVPLPPNASMAIVPTYIQVLKDRLDGAPREVGLMYFDKRTGSYGKQYLLGLVQSEDKGEKWTEIYDGDLPRWAANAARRPKPRELVQQERGW